MATDPMKTRMENQKAEFDAMAALAIQWNRLTMTAVVDDDYPAVRADYERALKLFIGALVKNRPGDMMNCMSDHG